MTRKTRPARSVADRNVERLLSRFGREQGRVEETVRRVIEASALRGAPARAAAVEKSPAELKAKREFEALYEDLRSTAARLLSVLSPGDLDAEALVHEVYLDLRAKGQSWTDRGTVLGVAVPAMRSILIERVRRLTASTRCARRRLAPVNLTTPAAGHSATELIDLHDALTRLAKVDERAARVVEYRYFAALTSTEIGQVLGIPARCVDREWNFACGWLRKALAD